jgi:hypothetical protein
LDSLIADFRTVSISSKYVDYLDSVNNYVKANAKTFEATLFQVINSDIISQAGQKTKFKRLLSKHPVSIDCWASW